MSTQGILGNFGCPFFCLRKSGGLCGLAVGDSMLGNGLGGAGWLLGGVHIRFFGNGGFWFRPYGESLGEAPSNQALLPLSFGASLWLGMPSLRSCSVGPPRSAILGRARLTRHPCRVAHCAEPALGLSRGRLPPQPPRRPESRPGSTVVRTLPHCGGCTNFGCLHIPPVGAGLLRAAPTRGLGSHNSKL
jgi:hypothetical protein